VVPLICGGTRKDTVGLSHWQLDDHFHGRRRHQAVLKFTRKLDARASLVITSGNERPTQ
jgi:hypothetical protein